LNHRILNKAAIRHKAPRWKIAFPGNRVRKLRNYRLPGKVFKGSYCIYRYRVTIHVNGYGPWNPLACQTTSHSPKHACILNCGLRYYIGGAYHFTANVVPLGILLEGGLDGPNRWSLIALLPIAPERLNAHDL